MVIVNGTEVDGWLEDGKPCKFCGFKPLVYVEEFDAYACPSCVRWTETCALIRSAPTAQAVLTRRLGIELLRFTRPAETQKGNRPSFSDAAPPEHAEPLYERFCAALAAERIAVARGVFGARMQVERVNDGPVTIVLDT